MDRDRVDGAEVRRVVLQELVHARVPDLDGVVRGASRYAKPVGMKAAVVYGRGMVVKRVDHLLVVKVPQPDRLVIAGRHNEIAGRGEARCPHPV